MKAWLHLDSWAGHTHHPVEVEKKTKKRFKVRLLEDCIKGPRGKVLYVPLSALTFPTPTDRAFDDNKIHKNG